MISTIVAAHNALSNNHCHGYGGGGPDDKEPGWPKWINYLFTAILSLVVLGMVVLVFVSAVFTDRSPEYEVTGKIVGYSHERKGRNVKVFVQLRQYDGVIRKYNTKVKSDECKYAPLNSDLSVFVTSSHNRMLDEWIYTTRLKYNPCK